MRNMEDMELESVGDVPDTPDRLMSRRYSNGKGVHNMDEENVNELDWRNVSLDKNGNSRRLENYSQRICRRNEVKIGSRTIGNFPLKKLHVPYGASLFRRASIENVHESRSPQVAEKNGKCKATCSDSALELSGPRKISLLDLEEEKGQSLKMRPAIPFHRVEDISNVESTSKKLSNRCNFDHNNFSALASSSCATTTKDVTVSEHSECPNLAMICVEMLDFSGASTVNTDVRNPLPSHPYGNQRFSSSKRLVQNGCISPHGTATRGKQSAGHYADDSHNAEEVGGSAVSSNIPSVDLRDIIADEKCHDKVKGKGLLIHSSTSSGNDAGTRDSSECFGNQGGWRKTSRHLRNPHWFKQDGIGHPSRMNNDVGCLTDMQQQSRVDANVSDSRQNNEVVCILDDAALSTSEAVSRTGGITESDFVRNAVNKRKRKQGTTSRNLMEGFSSVSQDSDGIFLDSSGEPSYPRSSEIQQLLGNWDAEVVPFSSEHRETIYLELDGVHNEELDARSRQLEADEKLALELQQQLYYEESALECGEMDEYLAWNLQLEEESLHNIGPSILHHQRMPGQSNRQPRLRYNQRPLDRRRARSQVFIPNRFTPSRSRIVVQSPLRVSDTTRFRFPPDMDLDMDLAILEALEAASGEFGDMGMADNVLNLQRDLTENDYEMLLALDENNHQHAGATANQISNLPQSKVQSTSIEEACAVCLETPTIGDTIRHLPCFHKFHKDCIDPWLRRKTSCPVCKSSIT